jgi:hypothetical protein
VPAKGILDAPVTFVEPFVTYTLPVPAQPFTNITSAELAGAELLLLLQPANAMAATTNTERIFFMV